MIHHQVFTTLCTYSDICSIIIAICQIAVKKWNIQLRTFNIIQITTFVWLIKSFWLISRFFLLISWCFFTVCVKVLKSHEGPPPGPFGWARVPERRPPLRDRREKNVMILSKKNRDSQPKRRYLAKNNVIIRMITTPI